ncbi:MAG: hypothetical protein JW965_08500 [Bacteroidales bacterium]|nr:hypothetical protein [Bacteroidales bacterium]
MSRIFAILFICLIFNLMGNAQPDIPEELTILYYNTDHLFDTTDDPGDADDEYLPLSIRAWDENRYKEKVSGIADYVSSAGSSEQPDIIALCSIENRKVVSDIISERKLRRVDYSVHITDKDGINAALVVNKDLVTVDEMRMIYIDPTFIGINNIEFEYLILYARCNIKGLGSCHFFINDWPGLQNDTRSPENLRIGAAIALRKNIDEILNFERDAKIIIMGTFYDEPTNRSLMTALNATNKRKNLNHRDLYNLFYDAHNINNRGTFILNNTWQMWDQIIVSSSLLNNRDDYKIDPEAGMIFMPEDVKDENIKLVSTYMGDEYTGGISSHLPVYCIIRKSEQ